MLWFSFFAIIIEQTLRTRTETFVSCGWWLLSGLKIAKLFRNADHRWTWRAFVYLLFGVRESNIGVIPIAPNNPRDRDRGVTLIHLCVLFSDDCHNDRLKYEKVYENTEKGDYNENNIVILTKEGCINEYLTSSYFSIELVLFLFFTYWIRFLVFCRSLVILKKYPTPPESLWFSLHTALHNSCVQAVSHYPVRVCFWHENDIMVVRCRIVTCFDVQWCSGKKTIVINQRVSRQWFDWNT